MASEPIVASSARKHGISDQDMLHTYANPIRIYEIGEGLVMFIGSDRSARMLEVGVVDGDLAPVIVHSHDGPSEVLEVMTMPRTVQEILDHADELARRFEDYEPDPSDRRDPAVLAAVRDAVIARSEAERTLATVVRVAHRKGHSWQSIGTLLGTSGEAARQRYGKPAKDARQSA